MSFGSSFFGKSPGGALREQIGELYRGLAVGFTSEQQFNVLTKAFSRFDTLERARGSAFLQGVFRPARQVDALRRIGVTATQFSDVFGKPGSQAGGAEFRPFGAGNITGQVPQGGIAFTPQGITFAEPVGPVPSSLNVPKNPIQGITISGIGAPLSRLTVGGQTISGPGIQFVNRPNGQRVLTGISQVGTEGRGSLIKGRNISLTVGGLPAPQNTLPDFLSPSQVAQINQQVEARRGEFRAAQIADINRTLEQLSNSPLRGLFGRSAFANVEGGVNQRIRVAQQQEIRKAAAPIIGQRIGEAFNPVFKALTQLASAEDTASVQESVQGAFNTTAQNLADLQAKTGGNFSFVKLPRSIAALGLQTATSDLFGKTAKRTLQKLAGIAERISTEPAEFRPIILAETLQKSLGSPARFKFENGKLVPLPFTTFGSDIIPQAQKTLKSLSSGSTKAAEDLTEFQAQLKAANQNIIAGLESALTTGTPFEVDRFLVGNLRRIQEAIPNFKLAPFDVPGSINFQPREENISNLLGPTNDFFLRRRLSQRGSLQSGLGDIGASRGVPHSIPDLNTTSGALRKIFVGQQPGIRPNINPPLGGGITTSPRTGRPIFTRSVVRNPLSPESIAAVKELIRTKKRPSQVP